MQPHDFWQHLLPPDTHDPAGPFDAAYPATLADGRQLLLPLRTVGDGTSALASLIINQASFDVVRSLTADLAERLTPFKPDVIAGLPTLGLSLAAPLAEALGHSRYVPFGTSRKFWYDEELSVPLSSVTTPDQQKNLFIDPRMLPLLEGKRVILVDDVISSGRSMLAGLELLEKCGIQPVAIAAAMLQSDKSDDAFARHDPTLGSNVITAFNSPMLKRGEDGRWHVPPLSNRASGY